ncbi:hypothetical protein WA158_005660 [Blastocystis sp. Blastoise]
MAFKNTLSAVLVNIFAGCITGYNTAVVSGLAYPLIKCTIFETEMSEDEVSVYQGLFNALILVFAMFGSMMSPAIVRAFGIRGAALTMSIIATICPIVMVLYKNFWYMAIIRGLCGLAVGMVGNFGPIYSDTYLDPATRTRTKSVIQFAITLSIIVAYIFNYFFTPSYTTTSCTPLTTFQYTLQFAIGAVFPILLMITLLIPVKPYVPVSTVDTTKSSVTVPESKPVETTQSSESTTAPSASIAEAVEDASPNSVGNLDNHSGMTPLRTPKTPGSILHQKKESIYSCKNIKYIFFIIMLAAVNQLTGVNGVIFYAQQILSGAGIEDALLASIYVVALWNCLTVFVYIFICDRLTSTTILNISLSIMIVGSAFLVVSFFGSDIIFFAFAGMMLYLLGYESGTGPIFYVVSSEGLPPELLEQGLSLANTLLYVFNIVISFTFPILRVNIGANYTFIILILIQVLCMIYFNVYACSNKSKKSTSAQTPKI